MWIGRQAAGIAEFSAEVFEVFGAQSAFEKCAGIHAGRGMTLEEDLISGEIAIGRFEEVILTYFIECSSRCKGGDVTAYAIGFFVGAGNHCHGIPAHETFDAALDFSVARIGQLVVARDGVDIRCMGCEGNVNAQTLLGFLFEAVEQIAHAVGTAVLQDISQGFDPFFGFGGIGIAKCAWYDRIGHGKTPLFWSAMTGIYIIYARIQMSILCVKFTRDNEICQMYRIFLCEGKAVFKEMNLYNILLISKISYLVDRLVKY